MDHTRTLTVGAPVYSRDGDQIGTVKEVRGQFFKVDAPMAPDFWMRTDAVGSSDGGQVMLSVGKDQIEEYKATDPGDSTGMERDTSLAQSASMRDTAARDTSMHTPAHDTSMHSNQGAHASTGGWDTDRESFRQRFTNRKDAAGARFEDAEPGYRHGYNLANDERFRDKTWTDVEPHARTSYREGDFNRVRDYAREGFEGRTIQLKEEQLRPVKEQVKAGEVGVRKEVVSEQQTVDVPLRREEVYIERRDVTDRPADKPIGEGETIRVPVTEERARLEKDTVVTGEVQVGKRAVEETQRLSGTVRHEEVRVEREGDVKVNGEGATLTDADRAARDQHTTHDQHTTREDQTRDRKNR